MRFLLCPILLLTTFPAFMSKAVEIPEGGRDIGGKRDLQASARPEVGRVDSLEPGKRLTLFQADPSKPFQAQFTAPVTEAIQKGERVLALIQARVVGEAEFGEVEAKFQLRGAPYTALAASSGIAISREWSELPVTFVATENVSADQAAVVLLCGHKNQTLEVSGIRLLKYPDTLPLAHFPKARGIRRSYPGREANAPWREAALARIAEQRQADLRLTVTDAAGQPVTNTAVKVVLRRHEFGFGSAINAKRLSSTDADDIRYREIIDRLFSVVVFENDLKDGPWSSEVAEPKKQQRHAELNQAFAWLAERHISVRGHYLMQVATPYNFLHVQDNALIRQRTLDSVKERLAFVQDRVVEWDVINHPIAWGGADMLNRRPGLEKLDREVFALARSLTTLPFYVNEDQVFRPGPQCDDTLAYIAALNRDGFAVRGLGNQAHFHESYLPSPEHLLAVTDRFAEVVAEQAVTEYDIVTQEDEELAADYTRDVLITVFSHPAYTSFLLWGFWEGAHWKPEAASWNRDWSLRPRGDVLEEWIGRRWRTELTVQTNAQGQVNWRGYPGWYDIELGGQQRRMPLMKAKPEAEVRF